MATVKAEAGAARGTEGAATLPQTTGAKMILQCAAPLLITNITHLLIKSPTLLMLTKRSKIGYVNLA